MSLTSFLKDTRNQEIRTYLKTKFVRPDFNFKIGIQAPPLTGNYAIVGNAFDYLFRVNIKHQNKFKQIDENPWIAELAFDRLYYIFSQVDSKVNGEIFASKFTEAKELLFEYKETGVATTSVIESAIFLAKLDLYIRARHIDSDYFNCSHEDVADIKCMLSLVDNSKFAVKERCWLNPYFGGSPYVGGADADVILDDTLIDIKTSKHLTLQRSDLNQIICYYILSLMGGVNCDEDVTPIKNIGLYFARYGLLWTIPLSEIGDDKSFNEFKNYLYSYSMNVIFSYDDMIKLTS